MAKKKKSSAAKKRQVEASSSVKFDDEKYGDVRFSATYRYGELELYKAAAYLGGAKAKLACYGASAVCILLMIFFILVDPNNLVPPVILLIVSLFFTAITSNWAKMLVYHARNSTLDPRGVIERRHVAVTADSVYEVGEGVAEQRYPLSELRRVYADDDGLVASFGQKRYVYVPASAMSTARFSDLARELKTAR